MPPEADTLAVVVDGELALTYDRSVALTDRQQAGLEQMDRRMEQGIDSGGRQIARPDLRERAVFVANQLLDALRRDNEALIAAATGYLATRLPDLRQVLIETEGERQRIELIFDRDYRPGARVLVEPPRLS